MHPDHWQLFTHPRFKLAFYYPADARLVATENPELGATRVHLSIPDDSALYFEVTHYPGLEAEAEYQTHKTALLQNSALKDFSMTGLDEGWLGSRAVYKYMFHWAQGERAVILVPQTQALYRLLYDPRSALNMQVLATLEFTD